MTTAPSERRTVTVLFAGLCDTAPLPPEAQLALLDALFTRFRAAIESRGGTVDKFIGDTVMAVFGAPVAHEDDPLRAVRAALAIRDGDTPVRIGVNTGEVLWGSVAGGPATAMGDVVNVARRLEEGAEAGEVLVGAAVERLTHRVIRYRALEPVRVKGREEAVRPYAAEGELGGETSFRRGPGREAPLVGRDTERARLMAAWEAGSSAFLTVEGEAGVGKTRLVADFRAEVRRRGGARVATGRALEDVRLPLAPFAEMVRGEAGVGTETVLRALADGMADAVPAPLARENLAHLIALSIGLPVPDARVRAIDPARLVAETHHAWATWATARGPALLCVEDLQWADDATLALLEALSLLGRPLMVVATARPGARIPAGFERMTLADLAPDAALRLAESALGAPLSPALRDFIAAQSGGNPFYVEELSRFLREEKLVSGKPLELAAPAGRIPAGLQGLLVARLDALDAGGREALKAASVLGRAFWRGLLGELLGRDAAPEVAAAARREMVMAQRDSLLPGDTQYMFRHALLRDAAYSLLPRKERARLHALAADRLEGRGGRAVRVLAAGHREGAGDPVAAARLWQDAATEALDQGAPAEGLAHAREAVRTGGGAPKAVLAVAAALLALARPAEALAELERLGDPAALPPDQEAEALNNLSRVYRALGRYRESMAAARRLADAAPEGAWQVAARIALASALYRLGDCDGSQREIERGQAILSSAPELAHSRRGRRLAGSLFLSLSNVHQYRGSATETLEACRRALEEARAGDDLATEAAALNNMANGYRAQDRADEALATYLAALEIDRRTGDRAGIASGLNNIGNIHRARGNLDAAEAAFQESLAIRRSIGDRAGIAACFGNLGNMEATRKRFEASLAWSLQSVAISREIGDRPTAAVALNNIAQAHCQLGALDPAQSACEESLAIRRETGDRRGVASSLNVLAHIFLLRSLPDRALALAHESLALCRETGDETRAASALLQSGRARLALGRADEAQTDFREALARATRAGAAEVIAEAKEALGEK